ncbi:MAG: Ppx/GppA family phosphatase [Novosphingobium sp.]|nr:Ppx/GppA family phosphatase [Novosphingobium sp.]
MNRNRNAHSADFASGNRRAIIDIGSNTVRLVIYGGALRAPVVLHNEKVAAGLGRNLCSSGAMAEKAMDVAIGGLERYALLLDDLGVEDVDTVATAAVRDASNGAAFLEKVTALGLSPRLLSGEEEALAGAMGVRGAFPGRAGVVADLGGGSLELTRFDAAGCETGNSLPLGTLRLPELRGRGGNAFRSEVRKMLSQAGWGDTISGPLYLVGGAWRALATYALRQQDSPLDDPHALELGQDHALELAKALRTANPADLAQVQGISAFRAAALPDAAALLKVLLDVLQPAGLVFSSWGLREGLLFARLAPSAQRQDPLLAGVGAFAAPRGGTPSAATRVAAWTVDALPKGDRSPERLRLAATMLALASHQIEPNFRIRQGIDWALHKRWIDLDSQGRASLAMAIAASCGLTSVPDQLKTLADERILDEAVVWGLAIRLCRRLGAVSRVSLDSSALRARDGILTLYIEESRAPLRNRGVEKDLEKLALCLRSGAAIEIVADGGLPPR